MNKLAIPATKDELRLFLRLMMNQKKKKKSLKKEKVFQRNTISKYFKGYFPLFW